MGLFDKKNKKLSDVDHFEDEIRVEPVVTSVPSTPRTPEPLEADHPDYGINKAIELMRTLPDDNIELVVRVVKATLESTNIAVATIIKDAIRKQRGIENRVDVLKKEIAALESQVATRQREIVALEADLKETSIIKQRLALSEKQNR